MDIEKERKKLADKIFRAVSEFEKSFNEKPSWVIVDENSFRLLQTDRDIYTGAYDSAKAKGMDRLFGFPLASIRTAEDKKILEIKG